jgi:hypothetical protein
MPKSLDSPGSVVFTIATRGAKQRDQREPAFGSPNRTGGREFRTNSFLAQHLRHACRSMRSRPRSPAVC